MSTPTATRMNVRQQEKTCPDCQRTLDRSRFPLKGRGKDDRRYPVCEDCYPAYRVTLRERGRRQHHRDMERRKNGAPVDRERCPLLPVEPIRRWLLEDLGVPPVTAPKSQENEGKVKAVAEWLHIDSRQIHRWRSGEAETTSLDMLDRAFCDAGIPWMLRELFPSLWEFDEDEGQVAA